jgi:large subunit ribosomal protein L43
MALNGIWQLQKLVVRYCDWGGSSRGIRCTFSSSSWPSEFTKKCYLILLCLVEHGCHKHLVLP